MFFIPFAVLLLLPFAVFAYGLYEVNRLHKGKATTHLHALGVFSFILFAFYIALWFIYPLLESSSSTPYNLSEVIKTFQAEFLYSLLTLYIPDLVVGIPILVLLHVLLNYYNRKAKGAKHGILLTLFITIFLSLILFYYNSSSSKEFSCFPEGRSVNCEVVSLFSKAYNNFYNDLTQLTEPGDLTFTNLCKKYFNDAAIESDRYYERMYERMLENGSSRATLNESNYICRESENGSFEFVYYHYRIGDFGGFCYDGSAYRQIYSVPKGSRCE